MRISMMLLPIAAAVLLAGCTPASIQSSGGIPAAALGRIDQAEAAYVAARDFAILLMPFFSEPRAAQVRAIMATVERAIAAARAAATSAQLAIEIARIREGTARIATATGAPG